MSATRTFVDYSIAEAVPTAADQFVTTAVDPAVTTVVAQAAAGPTDSPPVLEAAAEPSA